MNALTITKAITGIAVSTGVSTVVRNAIAATTPVDLNRYNRIAVGLGSVAVSGLLSTMAVKRAEDAIDAFAEGFNKGKAAVEENLDTDATE